MANNKEGKSTISDCKEGTANRPQLRQRCCYTDNEQSSTQHALGLSILQHPKTLMVCQH